MKKYYCLFILSFIVVLILSGCSKIVIVPYSPKEQVTFKKFIEISDRYSVILKEKNIQLSVLNNKSDIFIAISSLSDNGSKNKSSAEGPLLFFNEGNDNSFALKYPMQDIDFISKKKGDMNFRELLPDKTEREFEIGIYKEDVLIEKLSENEAEKVGIEVLTNEKNSRKHYFYRIPLTKDKTLPYSISSDADKFTVEFTMNNPRPNMSDRNSDRKEGMGERPSGGGGRPSGPPSDQGRGKSGGGREKPDLEQSVNKIELTIKLKK